MANRAYDDCSASSIDDDELSDRELIRRVRLAQLEWLRGLNRDRRDREWRARLRESLIRNGYRV